MFVQTWDGQWSFDAENVIIRSSVIDLVVSLAQPVTFTFEFYPRVEGNVATYVMTP